MPGQQCPWKWETSIFSTSQYPPTALENCFYKDQAKALELPTDTSPKSSPTGMERNTWRGNRAAPILTPAQTPHLPHTASPGPSEAVVRAPPLPPQNILALHLGHSRSLWGSWLCCDHPWGPNSSSSSRFPQPHHGNNGMSLHLILDGERHKSSLQTRQLPASAAATPCTSFPATSCCSNRN